MSFRHCRTTLPNRASRQRGPPLVELWDRREACDFHRSSKRSSNRMIFSIPRHNYLVTREDFDLGRKILLVSPHNLIRLMSSLL